MARAADPGDRLQRSPGGPCACLIMDFVRRSNCHVSLGLFTDLVSDRVGLRAVSLRPPAFPYRAEMLCRFVSFAYSRRSYYRTRYSLRLIELAIYQYNLSDTDLGVFGNSFCRCSDAQRSLLDEGMFETRIRVGQLLEMRYRNLRFVSLTNS